MNREEILLRISQLDQDLAQQPDSEELWIERGKLYWKLQDWQRCLADYDRAIALNPEGAAVTLRQSAMQIISFYHKDRYNP